jgi:hypothetical protein
VRTAIDDSHAGQSSPDVPIIATYALYEPPLTRISPLESLVRDSFHIKEPDHESAISLT